MLTRVHMRLRTGLALFAAVLALGLLPLGAASALGDWLDKNGAGPYETKFMEAGFTTVEDLGRVKESDLKKFGLKMKERKRVAMALKDLTPSAEQEAMRAPPQAEPLDPETAAAVNAALKEAQAAHQAGNTPEATKAMEKVVELDPKNPNWRMNLASLYQVAGDGKKALKQYAASMKNGGADVPQMVAGILPQMSSLLRKSGRANEALDLYEEMLEKHPDLADSNPSVALEHSQVLKATGDTEAAAKAKENAMCAPMAALTRPVRYCSPNPPCYLTYRRTRPPSAS